MLIARETRRVTLRVPDAIYTTLQALASENQHSLNREIAKRLEASIREENAQK